MLKKLFIGGLAFLILNACSESDENRHVSELIIKPSIIRMNAFFSDAEKYLSFPIWFNDSIVSSQHITSIKRRFFSLERSENSEDQKGFVAVKREKREYYFSPNGGITDFKVFYYFDDREIGSHHFEYRGSKDRFGFVGSLHSVEKPNKEKNPKDVDLPFYSHRLIRFTDDYLDYRNKENGHRLFFMMNKKYWSPLSIDSVFKPSIKDEVILGTPRKPEKRYRVQNKVNEKDIRKMEYVGNSSNVKTMTIQEYPFEIHRFFNFSKKGICTGFIDSTFSEDTFLMKVTTKFVLDKLHRPVKVIHKKENKGRTISATSIEIFTYE